MKKPTLYLLLQRALPPTLGALVFISVVAAKPLLFVTCESAYAFGKKPVTIPPPPKPPTPPPTPSPTPISQDVIRARWEGTTRDGATWSQYVFDEIPLVAPNLLNTMPSDIQNFCPNYSNLSVTDKKNFWVYLVSSIAQLESDFDPLQIYTESFTDSTGHLVQSVGLLQLSVSDSPNYNCGFNTVADVENPDKNLACGLKILNKWVGTDHVISGKRGSSYIGGARYWSTLRLTKLTQIEGWTRALTMCGN